MRAILFGLGGLGILFMGAMVAGTNSYPGYGAVAGGLAVAISLLAVALTALEIADRFKPGGKNPHTADEENHE